MGNCCVRDNNVVRNCHHGKTTGKGRLKSTRSSIYQINKENINDVYDFFGKISSGYYGTVKKACFKNDPSKYYAVKSIPKSNLSQKSLKNLIGEIEVLAKGDHPNIVKYYETYDDEQYFHLVMELCEGGELFERIVKNKRLKEKEASEILFKLAHAISHCHSRGIVHRDGKAENILFETKSENKNDVKIIDFGLARKRGNHNGHSIVGTPCYVAPEVLDGKYDRKCDIWAGGIITYAMLYGKYPFDDSNKSVLFDKIKTHTPVYDSISLSKEAINVMKEGLSKDPAKRPDAEKGLDNPWFTQNLKGEFKDSVKDLGMIPRGKSFKPPNEFIQRVIQFLVKEINSPEADEIRNKFYILDEKKTGVVDLHKYQTHIDPDAIKHINTNNNESKVEGIFDDCVLNKFVKDKYTQNNPNSLDKINYTSFMAANLKDLKLLNKDTVKQVFLRFDVENDGFLTIAGFHKALRRTGKQISLEETEKMLENAGFDNPNYILYPEFEKIIGDFLWDE